MKDLRWKFFCCVDDPRLQKRHKETNELVLFAVSRAVPNAVPAIDEKTELARHPLAWRLSTSAGDSKRPNDRSIPRGGQSDDKVIAPSCPVLI
jgi:hypothetical protein